MINLLIIESDGEIIDRLEELIHENFPDINLIGVAENKERAEGFLSSVTRLDLVLSEIQLSDGAVSDLFDHLKTGCPWVFLVDFNRNLLETLDCNCIEYLLKPVTIASLQRVFNKYIHLQYHFIYGMRPVYPVPVSRKRLIVKKGIDFIPIRVEEIVMFYTENKLVYIINKDQHKFICDKNLLELEKDLDPFLFLRVNRQYILNASFISGYRSFERVKLEVNLNLPESRHRIIVSQEMAGAFRRWLQAV